MLKLKLGYGQEEIMGGMGQMINDGWGERGTLLSRMGWVLQPELTQGSDPRFQVRFGGNFLKVFVRINLKKKKEKKEVLKNKGLSVH